MTTGFILLFESSKSSRDYKEVHPKPEHLKELMAEVSLGKCKSGFYVYTHRCQGKVYPSPDAIPKEEIEYVASTG